MKFIFRVCHNVQPKLKSLNSNNVFVDFFFFFFTATPTAYGSSWVRDGIRAIDGRLRHSHSQI